MSPSPRAQPGPVARSDVLKVTHLVGSAIFDTHILFNSAPPRRCVVLGMHIVLNLAGLPGCAELSTL